MIITAKNEDGVFKPLANVTMNEGTIVEIHVPSYADRLRTRSRSVRDFAFCGMWKDRTDIGDSVKYVSGLRRDIRGNRPFLLWNSFVSRHKQGLENS